MEPLKNKESYVTYNELSPDGTSNKVIWKKKTDIVSAAEWLKKEICEVHSIGKERNSNEEYCTKYYCDNCKKVDLAFEDIKK